jgi:Flp pilus assembly pilin Flp
MAEYGLIVALVAIVALAVGTALGSNIAATINHFAGCM